MIYLLRADGEIVGACDSLTICQEIQTAFNEMRKDWGKVTQCQFDDQKRMRWVTDDKKLEEFKKKWGTDCIDLDVILDKYTSLDCVNFFVE